MKAVLYCALFACIVSPIYANTHLKLSTTTSTDNTGLLKVLNTAFTAETGIKVAVISVGTGQALKLGANGDVDLALVHAPQAELDYVANGAFIDRQYVMSNDFVLVGPDADPANVKTTTNIKQAFQQIANAEQRFISRGDDSGTHKKELEIWQQADIQPSGRCYVQAGQGMGVVLTIAEEMGGYTLTDRGTQIAFQNKMNLNIVAQGDMLLRNPYHVMAVNPEKQPHVQYDSAMQYIAFITGEKGKNMIDNFKLNNQQLFFTSVSPTN